MNAGYGVAPAAEFLRRETREKPAVLLQPDLLGNPPEGVAVYLWKNPEVEVVSVPAPPAGAAAPFSPGGWVLDLRGIGETRDVYLVYPYTRYPQASFLRENPGFQKVWSYAKPEKNYSIDIFKKARDGLAANK